MKTGCEIESLDGGETWVAERHRVLAEVCDERDRQDRKWGAQNHPDGTGGFTSTYAKAACEQAFRTNVGTWRHILAEEVAEVFEEMDPELLRKELVQVAAVAVNWIEAIDRRRAQSLAASAVRDDGQDAPKELGDTRKEKVTR